MSLKLISRHNNSLQIFRDEDDCSICNLKSVSETCDKCGDGVCSQSQCYLSFPYKNNTNYILCVDCFNRIDNKLINYDHLLIYKFLKKHTVVHRRVSV